MNTQNQCLIVYDAGCYGTFVEWLMNFLKDPTIELPFNSSGNSHKFVGNLFEPKQKLFSYLESKEKIQFSRVHPGGVFTNSKLDLSKTFSEELDFYKNHFQKVLVLNYKHNSMLWCENNTLDKIHVTDSIFEKILKPWNVNKEDIKYLTTNDPILRLKHILDSEVHTEESTFTVDNLMGWNHTSIYDFELWQLRELLSFYWFSRLNGLISSWNKVQLEHKDILFVSIHEFKENFFGTVEKIKNHFELGNIDQETQQKLVDVYRQWLPLQKQINKDQTCKQIVDSIAENQWLDWSDTELSVIDEAWIQKSLRDQGILIKCDGLDVFPTNTKDFLAILETSS